MNYSIIRLIGIVSTFAAITPQAQAMELFVWPVKTLKQLALEEGIRNINEKIEKEVCKSETNSSYLKTIGQIQTSHASLPKDLKNDLATILVNEWANNIYTFHNDIITHFDGRQLSPEQRKLHPMLGVNASGWLKLSFDQLIMRYISVCVAKKNCLAYPFQLIPAPQGNERSVSPQYNITDIPNLELL